MEKRSESIHPVSLSALKVIVNQKGKKMSAFICTIYNQKGGSGKTTASVNLTGALGLLKKKVLLVDMDEQGTSTRWIAQSSDPSSFLGTPTNLAQMGGNFHKALRDQIDIYDFIIIDCPPAITSPIPSAALLISDLAILPVVPSPADLWAVIAAKDLAKNVQFRNPSLKVRVLLNMVQRQTSLARDAASVLDEDREIPLFKTMFGLRAAYRESQLLGATVHKVPRSKEAISEVDGLVMEVLQILMGQ